MQASYGTGTQHSIKCEPPENFPMSILTRKPDLTMCPICFGNFFEEGEKVKPVAGLGCEHYYHVDCIASYLYKRFELQPPCPTCRAPISEDLQKNIKSIDDKEEFEEVVEDTTNVYAGCTRRLVRSLWTDGLGGTTYYEGEPGKEYKVRTVEWGDVETLFRGSRGKEVKRQVNHPSGDQEFYTVNERLMEIKSADGAIQSYLGQKGDERLYRIKRVGGEVETYFADYGKNRESLRQIVYTTGEIEHYLGMKDVEFLHRVIRVNGDEERYEGDKNEEALRGIVHANGDRDFYKGTKGEERKALSKLNNGESLQFAGEKGKEYCWFRTLVDGVKEYYTTLPHGLVRKELLNGDHEHYIGLKGAEWCHLQIFANGDKHKFIQVSGNVSVLDHKEIKATGIEEFYHHCGPYKKSIHYPDGTIENFNEKMRLVSRSKVILQPMTETEYFNKNGTAGKKKKRETLEDLVDGLEKESKRLLLAEAFVNKTPQSTSHALIVRPLPIGAQGVGGRIRAVGNRHLRW